MTNKKILFVLPRMGGGGTERVTALVANALLEAGNDVSIYTLVGGDSFYELNTAIHYESVGISVNRSNKLTTIWSEASLLPKSFFAVRKLIKNGDYDVVISFLVETDIIVGLCKLSGLHFKHVCSERNDPTMRGKAQLAILNQIYKRADLFICQSQMVADFYKKVPEKNKTVIPNPINPENIPNRPIEISKRVVGIGKLMEQKNFRLLINSFSDVSDEFPEYKLDIYGEGSLHQELQALIDKRNMQEKITLRGAHKSVLTQIADAALFVMSSNFEGFPNVLLEAIAIGLPVISTDFSPGVAREIIGAENGLIVPVENEEEMSFAIKELLSDKNRRAIMSKCNREKAKAYYIQVIMKCWEDALSNVIQSD